MSKRFSPSKSSPAPVKFGSGQNGCLSLDEVSQFLSGDVRDDEREAAIKHLAQCDPCRELLVEMFRLNFAPVSEEERAMLESVPPVEEEETARQIVEKIRAQSGRPSFADQIRNWITQVFPSSPAFKPAFAFAVLALIALAGTWGWPVYRYYSLVQKSESLLTDQHRIYYRQELRPSGDYHTSPIAEEMGPEEESAGPQKLLQQALVYKPEGVRAGRLLAQSFLLESRFGEADSLLKLLLSHSPNDAAVLNDRGILYFRLARYDSAALAFERAFAWDGELDEALYNLAITRVQQGDTTAAINTWQKFLFLDITPEWRNAALAQLQDLNKQE